MTALPDDELFERHADLCQVLCNANRQKILHVLKDGEQTVTDLAAVTEIPQPTVSQHLRKMRDKGVLTKRSEGNRNYYAIRDERLVEASLMIRQVLLDTLDDDTQLGMEI